MADYALTGKKGTGKSKNAVRLIRDRYLRQGRSVATNLDLNLSAMFGPYSRKTYIRVPDKPSAEDLLAAGHGNPDSYDEDRNGGLFLDELGTWLNTRTFGDKGRAATLDFLAHARKLGWDCFYLMQNIVQVDKQLREAFIEFTVRHTRFDKVKWPFFGGLLGLLFGEKAAYMPRFHTAVARLGCNPQDMVTDRSMFRCDELNACYDTRQVFDAAYPHGTHSVLSPWHVQGRYMASERRPWWERLRAWLRGSQRRPVVPLTRPAAGWVRVRALCASLPPSEAAAVMARYSRFADKQTGPKAPALGVNLSHTSGRWSEVAARCLPAPCVSGGQAGARSAP